MEYNDLINQVSEEVNLSPEIVNKVYRAYWKSIRDTIQKLSLKDDLTEEQFNELRTNFNIPSIGKLCTTWSRVNNIKERYKYIRKLREKT